MASQFISRQLVTKKAIAARYGVSCRTIGNWMRRRILPYVKMSSRMVRFDPEVCDLVLKSHEFKSMFDQGIREELGRIEVAQPGETLILQGELCVDPVKPAGGQKDARDTSSGS
jgi:hypothetical protein